MVDCALPSMSRRGGLAAHGGLAAAPSRRQVEEGGGVVGRAEHARAGWLGRAGEEQRDLAVPRSGETFARVGRRCWRQTFFYV
jgi:hypothetical protein